MPARVAAAPAGHLPLSVTSPESVRASIERAARSLREIPSTLHVAGVGRRRRRAYSPAGTTTRTSPESVPARIRRGGRLAATTTSPESVCAVDVARRAGRHDDVARVGPCVDPAHVAGHDVDVARVRLRAHEPLAAGQLEAQVARVARQPRLGDVDPARLDVAGVGVDREPDAGWHADAQVAEARDEARLAADLERQDAVLHVALERRLLEHVVLRLARRTPRPRPATNATSPPSAAHDDLVDRAGEGVRRDLRALEGDVGGHEAGGQQDRRAARRGRGPSSCRAQPPAQLVGLHLADRAARQRVGEDHVLRVLVLGEPAVEQAP